MKSRQFTLGLLTLILIQLLSFKTVAQCCVAPENLTGTIGSWGICCPIAVPEGFYVIFAWNSVQKAGCITPVKYALEYRRVGDSLWRTIIVTTGPIDGVVSVKTDTCRVRCCSGCYFEVEWQVEGICSDTDTTAWISGPIVSDALPLTLLNFIAALNGKAAQLRWHTATEINTKNFIIQRSIDAIHFQNIGSVNAVDNSTQITSYSFDDAGAFNAGANKLYYRLQMEDKDGKFTYSNIATVQIVNEKPLVIYPNPVANELKLSGHLNVGGTGSIQIINSVGQTILREDHNFNSGDFNTGIDVSKLPPGVYLVVVNDNTDRTTLSIIKQ
jgi:hypothetical protein